MALLAIISFQTRAAAEPMCAAYAEPVSDHYDGELYFNPDSNSPLPARPAEEPQRRSFGWFWLRFMFGIDRPQWPPNVSASPGARPATRVLKGTLIITPIGHGTFLIQLDGLNILTDPIWSDRCSPVSWAGPKRHRAPGIRFEDLPPIDAVLISHNHYDHLDIPTLERLAKQGARRSITTLGNRDLIRETGIPVVDELDWWQTLSLSEDVTVTVVPAQHFSSRSLWDRNRTLWGGFVISGPSGSVYYSGDTGYGPHFSHIAKRFPDIRAALLPIAPFWPQSSNKPLQRNFHKVHMGPAEAVQAHVDLKAEISIAAHYQVFQLGADGFQDAPRELKSALAERGIKPEAFVAPIPGQTINLKTVFSALNPPLAAMGR
jgi:L-ascorbate metabolism protein UlaG (beta-lactamase superfamily)